MSEPQYEGFYAFDELRERGWHPGTIRHLFRNPSKVTYSAGNRIELFSQVFVHQMEADSDFERIQEIAAKESRNRFLEKLQVVERTIFKIEPQSRESLKNRALKYYNQRKHFDGQRVPLIQPPGFWEEIIVDYLISYRRERFDWSHFKSKQTSKIEEIQMDKLLHAIAQAYPDLTDECKKRFARLYQQLQEASSV